MYTQMPVQNQKMYPQNYVLPVPQNQNVLLPNQVKHQMQYNNQLGNQGQMMITTDKRKTFTPVQNQKGQMAYTVIQQPMQGQPIQQQLSKDQNKGQKKIAYSQGHPFPQQPPFNQQNQGSYPTQHLPQPQYLQPQQPTQQQALLQPQVPSKNLPQQQIPNNQIQPQMQNQQIHNNDPNLKKTPTLMTVNSLADLPYTEYPQAEYSHKPFYNIAGYAFNSYNGKVRSYNEDRTKTIVDYHKSIMVNGKKISPHISYFGVFDGHGGKGCSDFLRDNLHNYLFNSKYFPAYPFQAVKEAFILAEQEFLKKAYDYQRNTLIDKSGSCALIMLIINDILYAINLGDCRALFSTDAGRNLLQITRDHKPNDPIEKRRIERAGAKVYYANKVNVNGKEVELKEKDYGEGFTFPYRIAPGGISVSIFYNFYLGFKNNWKLLCKISSIWWCSRCFKCRSLYKNIYA